jgi:hypothetical protein
LVVRPGRVEVHVEELVLEGFPRLDRIRLEHAFARQLESALAKLGLRHELLTEPVLDGGTLSFGPGATTGELGRKIARRVAGTLTERPLGGGSDEGPV